MAIVPETSWREGGFDAKLFHLKSHAGGNHPTRNVARDVFFFFFMLSAVRNKNFGVINKILNFCISGWQHIFPTSSFKKVDP